MQQPLEKRLSVGSVPSKDGCLGCKQPKLIAGVERPQRPQHPGQFEMGEHRLDDQRTDVGGLREIVERDVELAILRGRP